MAASLRVLDNGTLRQIKSMYIMQAGVLRRIRTLKVMDGDELRTVGVFAPPLSVSANNVGVAGYNSVLSGQSTAVPTGGLSPYSYAWTHLSGWAGLSAGGSSATATFVSPTLAPGQSTSGTYRVTVTDSAGQTASADITIAFTFLNAPGSPL